MLYIVATPIGHLKDITLRAIEVLKSVDLIAAEDTRHSGILCREYGITAPLISCFEHNEEGRIAQILAALQDGKNVALISDAGTPGISDPGFRLVRAARENGLEVTVVPGACACIAALSLSAMPTDRFAFLGFMPVKPGARRRKIEEAARIGGTVIFYESPHRLLKSLKDIEEILGDPVMVVTREITKKFEERLEDKASALHARFTVHAPQGEFVLLLSFPS